MYPPSDLHNVTRLNLLLAEFALISTSGESIHTQSLLSSQAGTNVHNGHFGSNF